MCIRDRLYNHVADLGMIANDVGFGIAHIHTQRLREKLLRHNAAVTGHRLLRGGVGVGSAQWATEPDLALVAEVAAEVAEIVALTLDHSVVLDRFTGTAVLPGELARNLGTLGYVARASGLTVDARADHPQVDLGPGFTPVTQEGGDVLARYAVRASEFAASAALLPRLIGLAVAGGGGGGGPIDDDDERNGTIATGQDKGALPKEAGTENNVASEGTINPHAVRFSQDSANYKFKDGRTIDDLANGLRNGSVKPNDVPSIRLVQHDNKLYTLDNRRLEAFRRANMDAPYRMATPREIIKDHFKFTTRNDGISIRIRGGSQ